MEFWTNLEDLRLRLEQGDRSGADAVLHRLRADLQEQADFRDSRVEILNRYLKLAGIDPMADAGPETVPETAPETAPAAVIGRLDDYVTGVTPGVSLVTCCRNRNENLIKALPSWIACPDLSQIVIVDWSSDTPVGDDIRAAGLSDPRILIVRVDGESRWILSYAFNVGFRAARFDRILKVDADIVLDKDFFGKNPLRPDSFICGNWRKAAQGQEFINGFFYCFRRDLMAVNGFNEFITTYGWDDDELYDRLQQHGMRRDDVDPSSVFHLPHDDEQRLEIGHEQRSSARAALQASPMLKIRTNRIISYLMPGWGRDRILLPFDIRERTDSYLRVARQGFVPHAVPPHVARDAEYHAAIELLSWRHGHRAFEMDPAALDALLAAAGSVDAINRISIELAVAGRADAISRTGTYLCANVPNGVIDAPGADIPALTGAVAALAERNGLTAVFTTDDLGNSQGRALAATGAPLLPNWRDLGPRTAVTAEALSAGTVTPEGPGACLGLDIDPGLAARLSQRTPARAAPAVQTAPPRLFIDAQHGLGNRLRAIASAGAIAQASEREMVIVWQADHHCDCAFGDLFRYQGPVLDAAFIDQARTDRMRVYNYMTAEDGSEKDAVLDLSGTKDVYCRSAFVLNSPGSNWDRENRFLKALIPAPDVLDLVSTVRHGNQIGAHVRMEAGAGLDHNSYDAADNWLPEDHALIHHWRAQSHFSRFMDRIDALIPQGGADTIFLAADRPEIYEEFIAKYGDRIAYLPREVYDRSARQIQYALADALLLSECGRLLGSTWSSFSELALRLSDSFEKIEMSGKDF